MLELFGQLEDATEERMIVRFVGHKVGEAAGWFHWSGLCVVFPEFNPTNKILEGMMPKDNPKRIHLIMDFYSGHGAILLHDPPPSRTEPVIHHSFQLADLKLTEPRG